jgi:hypothetical protein
MGLGKSEVRGGKEEKNLTTKHTKNTKSKQIMFLTKIIINCHPCEARIQDLILRTELKIEDFTENQTHPSLRATFPLSKEKNPYFATLFCVQERGRG